MIQETYLNITYIGNLKVYSEAAKDYGDRLKETFSIIDKEIERIGAENVSEAVNALVEIMREYQQQVLILYPEHIENYRAALEGYYNSISLAGFSGELITSDEGIAEYLEWYKADNNNMTEAANDAADLMISAIGNDKGLKNKAEYLANDVKTMKNSFVNMNIALLAYKADIQRKMGEILDDLKKDKEIIDRLKIIRESGIIKEIQTGSLHNISVAELDALVRGAQTAEDYKLLALIDKKDYAGIFQLGANKLGPMGYLILAEHLTELFVSSDEEAIVFLNAILDNNKKEVQEYLVGIYTGMGMVAEMNALLALELDTPEKKEGYLELVRRHNKIEELGKILVSVMVMGLGKEGFDRIEHESGLYSEYWKTDEILRFERTGGDDLNIYYEQTIYTCYGSDTIGPVENTTTSPEKIIQIDSYLSEASNSDGKNARELAKLVEKISKKQKEFETMLVKEGIGLVVGLCLPDELIKIYGWMEAAVVFGEKGEVKKNPFAKGTEEYELFEKSSKFWNSALKTYGAYNEIKKLEMEYMAMDEETRRNAITHLGFGVIVGEDSKFYGLALPSIGEIEIIRKLEDVGIRFVIGEADSYSEEGMPQYSLNGADKHTPLDVLIKNAVTSKVGKKYAFPQFEKEVEFYTYGSNGPNELTLSDIDITKFMRMKTYLSEYLTVNEVVEGSKDNYIDTEFEKIIDGRKEE